MSTDIHTLLAPAGTLGSFQHWTGRMHRKKNEHLSAEALMACSALGLCGELGELKAPGADALLEAGDVLSYALNLACLWALDAGEWIKEEHLDQAEACAKAHGEGGRYPKVETWLLDEAITHALATAELMKKHVFQDRSPTKDEIRWRLQSIVQRVTGYMALRGVSLQQVMIANSVKLTNKYPEAAKRIRDQDTL